ncbi:MAG: hypothetical protein CMJ77_23805 [Planctomycetaceae bacterium]|nr:hypothetical protein [Planctomycetaceae bacterium]
MSCFWNDSGNRLQPRLWSGRYLSYNQITGRARSLAKANFSFQDGGRGTTTERRATTFFYAPVTLHRQSGLNY